MTVDEREIGDDDFAFFAYDTSEIYLYGWANINTYDGSTTDPTPVPYCRISSEFIASDDNWAEWVAQNNTLQNGDPVLDYMNRISPRNIDETNYNITDADGKLSLPLLKNIIVENDLNGQFVGNYFVTAHENIHGTSVVKQMNFRPYPNITAEENSFTSDFTFSWTYPPRDLAISPADIAVNPTPVVRGDNVEFNVTVHNIGGINVTDPFKVTLFVDGMYTSEAEVASMVERNGGTVNVLLTWQTDVGDYGDHNITVAVDSDSDILDGDRSNNDASINLHVNALYDLSVDPATIWWENTTYGNTYTDTNLTIHAIVANTGAGDIAGDITVYFYVNGVSVGKQTLTGLLSGASVDMTAVYSTSVPGDYNISVTVVAPAGIYDDVPENNGAYRILNTVPAPDLVISGFDMENTVTEGFNSTLTVTVLNDGDTYANGTITATFRDETAGSLVGTGTFTGRLLPGVSTDISVIWVPEEPAGDHYLSVSIVFVNATGEPPETVTDNNYYLSDEPVNVQLAYDLSISSTDITWTPSAPMTYENITISAEIHNDGLRDINTTFIVRFVVGGMPYYVDVAGVDAGDSVIASVTFSTSGSGNYEIDVTVDYTDVIPEYNEDNNAASSTLYIGPRPEFSVTEVSIVSGIGDSSVVDNHDVGISASVRNTGAAGTGTLSVYFYDGNPDDGGIQIGYQEFYDPGSGWSGTATISWTAEGVGMHTIYVRLVADTTPPEGNTNDNNGWTSLEVLPRPDLTVTDMIFLKGSNEINSTSECRDFDVNITIMNTGGLLSDSRVDNFTLSVFNGMPVAGDWSNLLDNVTVESEGVATLDEGNPYYCTISVERFTLTHGTANIYAVVDSGAVVDESNEGNNVLNRTITILQMQISVNIWTPNSQTDINMEEQSSITVTGQLVDLTDGQPVTHLPMTVTIIDSNGNPVSTPSSVTWVDNRDSFLATVNTPGSPGEYRIQVSATTPDGDGIALEQSNTQFGVSRPVQESNMWWIIILIVVIVVLAGVGGTLYYLKTHYAGKYVECGNCGRMIPAGSDKCPYCNAVFDKETVKCSSCGAWIPADAKECPKCGATFLVSGKEIVDYEAQMKQQYEEFVEKFRKQAKKEMGKDFTEKKFQQWWKTQKSYVTFEDWLKREEERKKTGGILCPQCGALNSKTDIVCHVCGSPLRATKKKTSTATVESAGLSKIELPSLEKKEEEAKEEKKAEQAAEENPAAPAPVPVKKVVKKKVVKKENEASGTEEKKVAELPPDMIEGMNVKKEEPKPESEEKPATPEEKPPMAEKKVVKKVVKKKVVKK